MRLRVVLMASECELVVQNAAKHELNVLAQNSAYVSPMRNSLRMGNMLYRSFATILVSKDEQSMSYR